MEKMSLANQQSTQASLKDAECTKWLIFNFHFLNFLLDTMEYAVQPIRMKKKKEFLAVSLTVTYKRKPESKLLSLPKGHCKKCGTNYPHGLSPTGYAITDSYLPSTLVYSYYLYRRIFPFHLH